MKRTLTFLALTALAFAACMELPGLPPSVEEVLAMHGTTTTSTTITGDTTTTIKTYAIIYVSSTGTGDGLSSDTPTSSLNMAIDLVKAYSASEIRVSGNFIDLNTTWSIEGLSGVTISGGWNPNFFTNSNVSILQKTSPGNVVSLYSSSIILSNFVLTGGSNDTAGGGLYLNGDNNMIDCVITNNIASNGSGICIHGNYNTVFGKVSGNATTGGAGAGIDIHGSYNTISGEVSDNKVRGFYGTGGGIYIDGNNNTVSATVFGNSAIRSGGGIYIYGRANNISGTVSGNFATNGGGIYSLYGNSIYAAVSGNTATYGGGIYFGEYYSVGADYSAIDCSSTISGNHASYGGGIYMRFVIGTNFSLRGRIYGNKAKYEGGGIYITYFTNVTISNTCTITNNRCNTNELGNYYGGGIYACTNSSNVKIACCTGSDFLSSNYRGTGSTEDNLYGITIAP